MMTSAEAKEVKCPKTFQWVPIIQTGEYRGTDFFFNMCCADACAWWVWDKTSKFDRDKEEFFKLSKDQWRGRCAMVKI